MLSRDRAEQILAGHAEGKPVGAIAKACGCSPATVRAYVNGLRTPGEPTPRADDFAPFAAYCRQRLADDPHLRTPALLAELSTLGIGNARSTIYHALERHGIQAHPCPDCHPASMSGYAPLPAPRGPWPAPLPVPAAPLAGEALASFLGRLAAANRTTPGVLLDILPPWFRVKARWHNDRWLPSSLMPWADDAAARLAVISGSTAAAVKNALPAFGGTRGQPVRAVTACRLCTAARRIPQPVPVHLPAHHQVCLTHGIWLSGPGTPQFSVSGCPDILAAEREARRIIRCRTIEQLIFSKLQATAGQDDHAWKRRTLALIETNPRQVTELSPQALFQAAAYPETIAAACASPRMPRDSRHAVSGGMLRWSREARPTLYLCGPRHGCLVSGPVTTGTESGRERDKRHYQRALFDGIARRYEASRPGYPPHVVEFVTATAGLGPQAAVLEVGCGTGQLTERLARSGFRLTAIDIGPSMIAAARRRLAGAEVSFQATSFEEMDAVDASFDLVISSAAFHWIDPEVAFSKSARLLRPGGWLALLGTEEHYDDPLGAALDTLWVTHGDTGGAWQRRPSDPEAIAATGLFGTPACLTDTQQATLPAADVTALESTRATFLSWPHDTQRHFTDDLGRLLDPQPAVHLTRHTSVTMAQVLRDGS